MLLSFLRRILDDRDLAACGVLADWLEEQGDARGVLLRRRWKRWKTERAKAEAQERDMDPRFNETWRPVAEAIERMGGQFSAILQANLTGYEDDRFYTYVYERFHEEWHAA